MKLIDSNLNITRLVSELSESEAKLFNNCFKLKIPDQYLSWFRDNRGEDDDDNVLLSCAEYLIDVVLGDCLKLMQHENVEEDDPEEDNDCKVGEKRASCDKSSKEPASKRIKYDHDRMYKECSVWSLWSLVWPRRKQVKSKIFFSIKSIYLNFC